MVTLKLMDNMKGIIHFICLLIAQIHLTDLTLSNYSKLSEENNWLWTGMSLISYCCSCYVHWVIKRMCFKLCFRTCNLGSVEDISKVFHNISISVVRSVVPTLLSGHSPAKLHSLKEYTLVCSYSWRVYLVPFALYTTLPWLPWLPFSFRVLEKPETVTWL